MSNDPYRILHVEDLEDNRGIVRQLARRMGVTLLEAGDGLEGVTLAKRELPDAILMDLSLPIMDGWEAPTQLKADPTTREIPITALTAHAMAGDEQRARCGLRRLRGEAAGPGILPAEAGADAERPQAALGLAPFTDS